MTLSIDNLVKFKVINKKQAAFIKAGAAAKGNPRPVLARAELLADGRLVSADNYRLHIVTANVANLTNNAVVNLPAPIAIYGDAVKLSGKYPDVVSVIPANPPPHVTKVQASVLKQALKQVGIFAKDSANSIRIDVYERGLALKGKSEERGDCEVLIPAIGAFDHAPDTHDVSNYGMELTYVYTNYRFMQDALKGAKTTDSKRTSSDTIAIHIDSAVNPLEVRNEATGSYALIMPMSVSA